MSEQLCLQWNDFKENVNSAFGRLRGDQEFVDVTLVCEDGQHLKAHKVILAASSPFFEGILRTSKHPHPLIYLKGFQSKVLLSILDFLYFGEANVYQEELDSFLAIAEEIKLKGLTGQTSDDVLGEQKKSNTNADCFEPSTDTKRENRLQQPLPGDQKKLHQIVLLSTRTLHWLWRYQIKMVLSCKNWMTR